VLAISWWRRIAGHGRARVADCLDVYSDDLATLIAHVGAAASGRSQEAPCGSMRAPISTLPR
jgi:hypothetical protein